MISAVVALIVASSSASGLSRALVPAPTASIIEGARVCTGAIALNGAALDKQFDGWTLALGSKAPAAVAARPAKGAKAAKGRKAPVRAVSSGGTRVFFRDSVMVVVKGGAGGACIVDAKGDTAFEKRAFYAALGQQFGVPVASGDTDKAPLVTLPSGEAVKVVVTGDHLVKLVFDRQTVK